MSNSLGKCSAIPPSPHPNKGSSLPWGRSALCSGLLAFCVTNAVDCTCRPSFPGDAGYPCDAKGGCLEGYGCDAWSHTCIAQDACALLTSTGACLRCGDGVVTEELGEACDLGADNNSGGYGGCNSNCTLSEHCGDGIVQVAHELCDYGNANSDAWQKEQHCKSDCQSFAPYCGDGLLQAGDEDCDAGNTTLPGCTQECKATPSWLCQKRGNGIPGSPGRPDNICYECGNGVLDPTEDCDGGGAPMAGCGNDCQALEHWNCTADNSCYECGNGIQDPGELCDDGDTDWCTPPCGGDCESTVNTCGDGVARCGEECDGNDTAASFACQALGFTLAGTPGCDDSSCRVYREGCTCSAEDADLDGDATCDAQDPTPAGTSACGPLGAVLWAKQPLTAADVAVQQALSHFGYTIELLPCPAGSRVQTEAAELGRALATSRLVVVAPSCEGQDISEQVLSWMRQGVVLLSPGLFVKAHLTSTIAQTDATVFTATSAHFVNQNLSTPLLLYTGPTSTLDGSLAQAAVLASADDAPTVVAVNTGEALVGAQIAAGRRVAFGPGQGDVRNLTMEGRVFFERVLLWAAGADSASTCQFCSGADADNDGYGSACDCDDGVPTCNDAGNLGTAELPARNCTANFDADAGYEAGATAQINYAAPDCYEVMCGSEWDKGLAVAPDDPHHGTDCMWVSGSYTLADAVATATSSSDPDFMLVTTPPAAPYASSLNLTTAGPVWLTSVVPLDLGGQSMTMREGRAQLARLDHVWLAQLRGTVLVDSTLSVLFRVSLGPEAGAVLRHVTINAEGDASAAPSLVDVWGDNVQLSDVALTGCNATAILLRADRAHIENSHITCGKKGVVIDGTGVGDGAAVGSVVANNVLAANTDVAIEIAVGSSGTVIDNNTLTGVPFGPSSWAGPAFGVIAGGSEEDLCLRNNIFSYLGNTISNGYALDLRGPLTFTPAGKASCRDALAGVLWNNAVFAALGNCNGPDCATLPCRDYPSQSLCSEPALLQHRFFPFATVQYAGLGRVNSSTNPSYSDASAGNWCVRSALLHDAAADLGYARLPPYWGGDSFFGVGADIGALEAGSGTCRSGDRW